MRGLGDAVKKHQDGAVLNIIVTTGDKKCFFPAGYNKWRKRVEMRVTAPPKDNKANMEIIKTSAEFFNHPMKKILIVSGKKSREKAILIKDISVNHAVKRLKESLDGL